MVARNSLQRLRRPCDQGLDQMVLPLSRCRILIIGGPDQHATCKHKSRAQGQYHRQQKNAHPLSMPAAVRRFSSVFHLVSTPGHE